MKILRVLLVAPLAALLPGCENKELKNENAALRQKVESLWGEKSQVEKENVKLAAEVEAIKERLSNARAELDRTAELAQKMKELAEERATAAIQLASRLSTAEAALEEINRAPKEGEVSGVVTYYFNRNFGDKPDVGAQVCIHPDEPIARAHFDKVTAFLAQPTKGTSDTATLEASLLLQSLKSGIYATVDGNGSFRRKLPPGKYLCLIVSKHRQSMNQLEIMGKLHAKTFTVEQGKETSFSWTFQP